MYFPSKPIENSCSHKWWNCSPQGELDKIIANNADEKRTIPLMVLLLINLLMGSMIHLSTGVSFIHFIFCKNTFYITLIRKHNMFYYLKKLNISMNKI